MPILGLTGKARSGKDTVGKYLIEHHGFVQYAMALPLKTMLHVGLGLDPQDYETTEHKEAVIPWLGVSYRTAAQTLGTDWMRVLINKEGWLIVARRNLKKIAGTGVTRVVITDIRFENEASMVRELGGVVIHLSSNRALEGMTNETRGHVSEDGVAIGPDDWVLRNNGSFLDLFNRTEDILELISQGWK